MVSQTLPIGYMLEQKYRIIKLLGQGAFGATYLVEHTHFGTKHVIKEYLPDSSVRTQSNTVVPKSKSDEETFIWGLKRFFDEAKLLYRLNHPNIVKVTDLFEVRGTAYFVMPYLGNNTFQSWINHHPKPTEDELLAIFIPLLEGLKYIHAQGLLHRDIKPENILISHDNTPIFIDFGSARNAIGRKSKLVTRVLTPHFAPFEQYSQNITFSEALDLYSLAASMYQAIVGDYPPLAPDRVIQDDIIKLVDIPKYQQRYSHHFLQAIDKNLSFKPQDRDQTALEMQNSLLGYTAHITNEPIIEQVHHTNEWLTWQETLQIGTTKAYQHYLDIYPVGQYASEAKDFIAQLQSTQEQELWADVSVRNTEQAYREYLSAYPYGQFIHQANQAIQYYESFKQTEAPNGHINTNRYAHSHNTISSEKTKLWSMSRIGRLHYWNYSWIKIIFILILGICAGFSSSLNSTIFADLSILCIAVVYVGGWFILGIRRLKDLNQPVWNILWSILIIPIPFLNLYFLFAKGDEHTNQYGNPPQVNTFDKYLSVFYVILSLALPIVAVTAIQSYQTYAERAKQAGIIQEQKMQEQKLLEEAINKGYGSVEKYQQAQLSQNTNPSEQNISIPSATAHTDMLTTDTNTTKAVEAAALVAAEATQDTTEAAEAAALAVAEASR